jgi:transcriptional regulator with XRE-family HTH domain
MEGRMGGVAKKLESIGEKGGVSGREIAELLETTAETVSRWKSGRIEPQKDRLERILELDWLMEKLSVIYPDPRDARMWLLSRHKLLQGDTPANRIQKGKIDDVLDLVAQLEDGAYI